MSWGIFKIGDWINHLKTPRWIVDIIKEIQDIIISIALDIGKQYLMDLQEKIIETASLDVPSEKKFMIVFTWARKNTSFNNVKDSALNLLIEALVNRLKQTGFSRVK